MSLFNFQIEEMLTFFAVLIRFSILFAILPFIGDRFIPAPVKVLLALAVSFCLFPALVRSGQIHPENAVMWSKTAGGIVGTVFQEALFALILGFTARLIFEGINIGANFVGNFMGFASASSFDPHQESQTEVIAQIQTTLAMMVFLALDGHHLMLRASLESYRIVGLAKVDFSSSLTQKLIHMSGETLKFGLLIASPVALSLFSVNTIFGIMSKAMPQLNILALSFGVTSLVGFLVILISFPEFKDVVQSVFERMGDWLTSISIAAGRT